MPFLLRPTLPSAETPRSAALAGTTAQGDIGDSAATFKHGERADLERHFDHLVEAMRNTSSQCYKMAASEPWTQQSEEEVGALAGPSEPLLSSAHTLPHSGEHCHCTGGLLAAQLVAQLPRGMATAVLEGLRHPRNPTKGSRRVSLVCVLAIIQW